MKKFIAILLLVCCAAMAVTACSGKKSDKETASTEETLANGYPVSKQPDPNAPVLDSMVIYAPQNGKMEAVMDAADKLTGEAVMEKLVEYGTVGTGTTFVSLDIQESAETEAAGPGAESGASTEAVKTGVLTISGFTAGEGLSEEDARQAVINTYKENFELSDVTLTVQ